MRCHYREHRYFCGEYLSSEHGAVFRRAGQRKKKAKPTREAQKQINERMAINSYIRTVHANFGPDDLSVGLDYRSGEMPANWDEAKKVLDNFLKRLRRWYSKNNTTLKYMIVTEVSKRGKVHHHIILSNMGDGVDDRKILRELWGNGRANSDLLQFDENGIKGLAIYVASDALRKNDKGSTRLGFKRWSGSRNLIKPKPQERNGHLSNRETAELCVAIEEKRDITPFLEREYPGYELVEAWTGKNPVTGTWRLELWLIKKSFAQKLHRRRRKNE